MLAECHAGSMIGFGRWVAIAALFSLCGISALAQDAGYWRAESKTAQSITGDIAIGEERLLINFTRYTIAPIRSLTSAEVSSVFDVPADAGNKGSLYRLSIPGDKKMLHRNTLCGGEETQWMATFVNGKSMSLVFFSGGSMPVFTPEAISNTTALCGSFSYRR